MIGIASVAGRLACVFATFALASSTPAAAVPAAPPQNDAPPALFAMIVGVNRSVDPELPPLRYADDDAVRYDDLFRTVGARTVLLTRPDDNTRHISSEAVARARLPRRSELDAAMAGLAADVAAARRSGRRTVLYFIYAGHGNVTGADAYLALEDARLTAPDIERTVIDRAGADETHLVVDACFSYFLAYGRGPGGTRREVHGFAPVEGLARREDVGLLLSTTVARESHEWEGFQAGVFSHEVRSGLFGAADFDGDGAVSYRELAAFVTRANAAIANERFRPQIFARPPRGSDTLLNLRGARGARHLRVSGAAPADHYVLEDARGTRVAEFHNTHGHALALVMPPTSLALYLRRASDGRELAIPTDRSDVDVADLPAEESRVAVRGAAHDAFSLIFALPFDDQALSSYAPATDGIASLDLSPALPRWRRRAAIGAASVASGAIVAAVALTLSAHGVAVDARGAPTQAAAADLNDRLATRKTWAVAAYGVTAAAASAAVAFWLWPTAPVRPAASLEAASASIGLGGRF